MATQESSLTQDPTGQLSSGGSPRASNVGGSVNLQTVRSGLYKHPRSTVTVFKEEGRVSSTILVAQAITDHPRFKGGGEVESIPQWPYCIHPIHQMHCSCKVPGVGMTLVGRLRLEESKQRGTAVARLHRIWRPC